MAHLFVLENSKRHILLYGQYQTAPHSSPCSVVYLLIQIHYISSTRSVGGNTFIKYLCLEHSERNDTYYEWIRIPDAIPSAFLFFDCPALPVFTTRAIRVPPKFPVRLSIHATFYDPDRPSETLPLGGFFAWTSVTLNTSSSALRLFPDPLWRGWICFRRYVSLWPAWFSVYTSPSGLPFRRNTWYGWLAKPYPARTFTLLDKRTYLAY